jgi:hypothetical protein
MTTTFLGTTFPTSSEWHVDEKRLIQCIHDQIDLVFPDSRNLFINTTWFGPQFDNNLWHEYKQTLNKQEFDRLFLLAAADPVFLNHEQIEHMQKETNAILYSLGHFDTEYYFNFHSQVLPCYFTKYTTQDLIMQAPAKIYVNYNRKPRDHRSALVNNLIEENLLEYGIVTLGKHNNVFSKEVVPTQCLTLNETTTDAVGNWGLSMEFGIPHDIHSLGNMDIWRSHFLTVVGETEFFPWDNMFISEKTWKPILGLRPFVINGQTKIYKYLRDQGFKTFNHYFNGIDLENINELEVHDSIIAVVQYLTTLDKKEIIAMYNDMLPDLKHNRNRFFEFAKEQQYKINHIFE